jgi:uncharacterized Zn finger protein
MGWGWSWKPYVPVAEKRRRAEKKIAQLKKKGRTVKPVALEGRTISRTFWGKAWCDNLESYSDYENRLPRGRAYLRNGSVVHLEIAAGRVEALVSGSELYQVKIDIAALAPARWKKVTKACPGGIASLVELLQGKLSAGVMATITRPREGLFPAPKEISLKCSCPDWAGMCKHVAAALYGVGARLDEEPDLLFLLRQVDHTEMIDQADAARIVGGGSGASDARLSNREAAEIFGIELEGGSEPPQPPRRRSLKKTAARAKPAAKKGARPAATKAKRGVKPAGAARKPPGGAVRKAKAQSPPGSRPTPSR